MTARYPEFKDLGPEIRHALETRDTSYIEDMIGKVLGCYRRPDAIDEHNIPMLPKMYCTMSGYRSSSHVPVGEHRIDVLAFTKFGTGAIAFEFRRSRNISDLHKDAMLALERLRMKIEALDKSKKEVTMFGIAFHGHKVLAYTGVVRR